MSKQLHTEELIRTRLEGAELPPSSESWKAIRQKLRWQQFLRFNPGRFNVYYAAALLLAIAGLLVILAGGRDQPESASPEENTIIQSPGENDSERNQGKSVNRRKNTTGGEEHQSDLQIAPATTGIESGTGDKSGILNNEAEENASISNLKDTGMAEPGLPEPDQTQQIPATPLTYFTSSIQSGCAPLTVQFTNQSVNATAYYWDFGTGESSRERNPVYEFKEAGRFVVTLTAENHGGQPTVSRMMVEVLESPVADFQIDEGLEGMDHHVVLNLVNYSSDASVFAWNMVDENCIDCNSWSSIEYQPAIGLKSITPDSRAVKLEVINENGCSDTAIQQLPLVVQSSKTRIKFPTAFSPNPSGPGDGSFAPGSKRIDLFYPVYIEVPAEYRMRIFTRRGELIFETREIYQGWDGYLHQEPAPRDVYVWMVEGRWADGEPFSMQGDVTLVWNKFW